METDGDEFEAGVTGREAHFCQLEENKFAERGLPGTTLQSELMRELLSPSDEVAFFLKLKARRKPPVGPGERGEYFLPVPMPACLGGI